MTDSRISEKHDFQLSLMQENIIALSFTDDNVIMTKNSYSVITIVNIVKQLLSGCTNLLLKI